MARTLGPGQVGRQLPRRRLILIRGHVIAQRSMRRLVVVFAAEPCEAALLGWGVRFRGACRLRFEDPMKLLMRSVLFVMAGRDPQGLDPQRDPLYRQPR